MAFDELSRYKPYLCKIRPFLSTVRTENIHINLKA